MSSYLEMWKKVVYAGCAVVLVWGNLYTLGIIDFNFMHYTGLVEPGNPYEGTLERWLSGGQ